MLLLLLAGAGEALPGPDDGVTFEALGLRVLFEVSEAPPFDPPVWHDLSAYIDKSSPIRTKRGRSYQFDEVQAGTLDLTLDATNGDLDPKNLASPHNACLRARRRCRLRVIYDDVVYPVFDGYTHGFPRVYTRPNIKGLIPFKASDGFRLLNSSSPTAGLFRIEDPVFGRIGVGRIGGATTGDQLSGALIDALLDTLAWPDALRDLAAGRVLVSGADVTERGLAAIQDANAAEGGDLFISRDGKVTTRDRLARYVDTRSNVVQATFYPRRQSPAVPVYTEPFGIAADESRIINEARYTGVSGVPQIVRDEPSIDEYELSDHSLSLIAVNDGDVESLARLVVADNAEPGDRYENLTIPAHVDRAANFPAVFDRELFDLIALEIESTWGAPDETVEALVQGIDLTIDTATVTAELKLGPYHPHDFFTIGHPTLGAVESVGAIAP